MSAVLRKLFQALAVVLVVAQLGALEHGIEHAGKRGEPACAQCAVGGAAALPPDAGAVRPAAGRTAHVAVPATPVVSAEIRGRHHARAPPPLT